MLTNANYKMNNLNHSFTHYLNNDCHDTQMEVDIEDKITYSTFNMNFVKIFENLENIDNNSSSNIQTYNFSPPKKKNSLELSDFIEQTFCENSNINIEEEFHNEETCKDNLLN